MRVAIVLNTSWNIYNFRMNFIRALMDEGHEIHTIAPADKYTHLLQEAGCHHHNVKMDSRGANLIKDTALMAELFFIYRRIKPDIILHYTIKPNVYGTLAASLLRIPTINNVCGLGTVFLKKNLVSWVALMLYRISFRFASKVFFQNPEDKELFIRERLVPNEIVDLLPGSGIDLSRFSPLPYKRKDTFTFLLISRLITDKGILEYIQAIRKLKAEGIDAHFQVLGALDPHHKRGIQAKLVQSWIDSGLIEYLGTTDDVKSFIEKADCIVLPSYREGTPRTLLEAASSSRPIVATDVPGCRQVVEDGTNGFLCKLKDVEDLAFKMKRMTSLTEDELRSMGDRGRRKMEIEFDEKLVVTKYIAAINNLPRAS